MTETNDASPAEITKAIQAKESMEKLVVAIGLQTATKEGIAEIAKEVADSIANPLVSTVAIKPLEEFLSQVKSNLKDKAIEAADELADSQKRIGNLMYATAVKKTYKYDNPILKQMKAEIKELEEQLKESGDCTHTSTPYIRVTIPKS